VAIICSQINILAYVPVQVDLFKESVKSRTEVTNCANCDFRGTQELAGVDAHGTHMPGVTLQPCTPTKENEKLSNMICIPSQASNLTGTNIAHSNCFSSCLDEAILVEANLTGTDLTNSSVQRANLKDAKVAGIITENASFCDSVMPDGSICSEGSAWTGQGVTIQCNCDTSKSEKSKKSQSKSKKTK